MSPAPPGLRKVFRPIPTNSDHVGSAGSGMPARGQPPIPLASLPVAEQPATINSVVRIIAEGPDWLVIDKPPYLQVHPSKPGDLRTLWHHLRELLAFELANGGQISLINRLDRETSGLVLIAKSRSAARHFHGLMERREFRKEYLALVWGWPEQGSWTVEAPLLRQGARGPSAIYLKQAVHPEGAAARTGFTVEQKFHHRGEPLALVRARPLTGRLHQIRVHLAHSGHPVVGDKIYGPDERCYLEFIETGWTESLAARLLLPRHALHAAFLAPPDQEWHAPLPPDLQALLPPEPLSSR